MPIQKLGFKSTLQLLEFIKAVITEFVVRAVCMISGPQISQASGLLHLLFPKCLNSETANLSFLIWEGGEGT